MGIYRHLSVVELEAMRSTLMASLQQRLTAPTSAGYAGRSVQFGQKVLEIRSEIEAIGDELNRRKGISTRGPFYLA